MNARRRSTLSAAIPCIALLLASWLAPHASGSDNLLTNGEFSTFGSNGVATSWTFQSAGGNTYTTSQDLSPTGTAQKLDLIDRPGSWGAILHQAVTLELDTLYELTIVYKTGGSPAAQVGVANPGLSSGSIAINRNLPGTGGEWSTESYVFNYNVATATHLRIAMNSIGTLWIDSVVLTEYVESDEPPPPLPDWVDNVRTDRPRMFFNQETFPKVRDFVRDHKSQYYASMISRVRARPDTPPLSWGTGANPSYGPYAMEAAFVWLMEGDSENPRNNPGLEALEKAKNYLFEAVEFYHRQIDAGQAVNWYSASRVCALAAYDWIHDQLTPEEREYFVERFIEHHQREFAPGANLNRLNAGGITGGFYGPPNLPWYIGVAFHGDGIADDYAAQKLVEGHDRHIEFLEYRAQAAGEDGGAASVATGYAFQMYPWTELNFMHTYNSAMIGGAIEDEFDHLSLFPNWVLWKRIPGIDGNRSYGLGDTQHSGNGFVGTSFLEMHMLQIGHFFAQKYPDRAALALWVREEALGNPAHDLYWWPLAPALAYRTTELPEPIGPDEDWPLAKAFRTMGAVFMKSGWTPEDTHAVFVAEGNVNSHRHFDQGHFIIYHKGFLALDAGTYGDRLRNPHITEYFYRTVAHNSILIHSEPGQDATPVIWGGGTTTRDGGQYAYAGELAGFATNNRYSYAATDMTAAYSSAKAAEVIRQLVFVKPDTFVVFDRVESTQANYEKAWLLQTAREPEIQADGRTFRAVQNQGALLSRTLLPEDPDLVPVGGPGKEFWSAGQNWEPSTDSPFHELWGAWRMEVRPTVARERDEFLHVFRVGDATLESMGDTALFEDGDRVSVQFDRDGETVTVSFNRTGEIAAWWGEAPRDPMGRWHTYEIMDHAMNVDTGGLFGVISVDAEPWFWMWKLRNWAFLDRDALTEAGGWAWILNSNPPASGATDSGAWNGYPMDANQNVETGDFLGDINVSHAPWVWVWRTGNWAYFGSDSIEAPGSWLWFLASGS